MILCNFKSIPPEFLLDQEPTLEWLALAHTRAESLKPEHQGRIGESFQRQMSTLFRRYGCSSDRIQTRRAVLRDFTHTDWDAMELFSFKDRFQGPTMDERVAFFRKVVEPVCKQMYPETGNPPDHLIHVTCTGYVSPSCAQELVARNHWHDQTVVTHAYHMGCYAALPAIRMAKGFLAGSPAKRWTGAAAPRPVDVLHTEVCSIHLQTDVHTPEQMVVQSLFADGFIKYSAVQSKSDAGRLGAGLNLEAIHEVMVPDTLKAITWDCSEWGMKMGLMREVPQLIAESLQPFVEELCRRARVSLKKIQAEGIFAIHPGGPKIINQVQSLFHVSDDQVSVSKAILKQCGNMSSATLPHIWEAIVANPAIPEKTYVLSLAFGPGLCISGAILRKVS